MLAELEQGLVNLVKGSELGKRLRAVEVVPEITEDIVRRMVVSVPAVFVSWRSFKVNGDGVVSVLDVVCLARNARNPKAARHGDGSEIGLYQIVDALAALLAGFNSQYKITTARADRSQAWGKAGVEAAALTAEHSGTVPQELDLSTLDDFIILHADYDIEPFASPAQREAWSQEENGHEVSPDAEDQVTLEQ